MTSILFLRETIEWEQFTCIYMKNHKLFRYVCVIFQIYIKFWTFAKKKDSHSFWISEIKNPEKRGEINL